MWVRALADADAACGGKALGLARMLAAGLPVPGGFVVDAAAFRAVAGLDDHTGLDEIGHRLGEAAARIASAELPAELVRAVDAAVAALGAPALAVRSSATIEDGSAGAAAGVFSSQTAVAAADVWSAIRAVWTSALTPLAAAYARRRHAGVAIAVIVQRFVGGERATVYTRPPGRPPGRTTAGDAGARSGGAAPAIEELAWVQRGDRVDKVRRDARDPLVELALAAETATHAIDARGGADVELVLGADRTWIVQARPIVDPPAIPAHRAPPPIITAPLADGRTWTWDVTHNPDPLSPAQQGLVERVERAAVAPWSMRLCAGYLYTSPRGARAASSAPWTYDELAARYDALEQRLAACLQVRDATLADALARYVAFYEIWAAEVVPLIAAARAPVRAGARASAVERVLVRAARGELDEAAVVRELGELAPAWDVAAPTYGERPEVLRAAIEHARRHAHTDTPPSAKHEVAELAADLAERDDMWFARAQAMVRRAILARSAELGIAADDACWISLDELLAGALDDVTAKRRAAAARSAAGHAAAWQMPRTFPPTTDDDKPRHDETLRGIGTGGRVVGRVVRYGSLTAATGVGHGDVIVTRAVTPALAVFVVGCAGLVSETGGPLDHGAAMARELGIPCIVGCRDAMAQLADGMVVRVDADAGTVELIG
ncbi:MAG: hypothetical protein KF773_39190 [Deltaproteobacteria bacterium]|nr:hypothetical protein [Deltaproteobacteria bacterium]